MNPLSKSEPVLEPQLSPIDVELHPIKATIGLLSSETISAPLLLSLKHIEEFVNERVAVLIQRGLGDEHEISDYEFTEYGADIMEDEPPIMALSNILVKYDPFSLEEILFLKNKQIIISTAPPELFTHEMVKFLHEQKITAVGINFLNLERVSVQDAVKQIVSLFVFSKNIRQYIQLNPLLLKSIYCYNGEICNRVIAESAGVPWKDLAELCWNWN